MNNYRINTEHIVVLFCLLYVRMRQCLEENTKPLKLIVMGKFRDVYSKNGNMRKIVWWALLLLTLLLAAYLFLKEFTSHRHKAIDLKPPEKVIKAESLFEVSSKDVIFEISSGGSIRISPKKALQKDTEIKIQLDDTSVIDTIGSFKVMANSTQAIFIPIHGKGIAGHCIMSFSSKSKELENLFKLQVRIKAVHVQFFGYLSIMLGWCYFIMWSTVYYPQIYQNFIRKSVVGFSFDYLALNMTGHLCYCLFNAAMYSNSFIQKEYSSLHPKGELPVKINDVLFSFHAIVMNCILIGQCVFYERAEQKISTAMGTLVCGLWASIFGVLFLAIAEKLSWLQYLYFLSYIKVATTPIKYTPQVYLHYVKKSTEGWSIYSVMLDFCGGTFSFLQMGIDAVNNDDWDGTWGNPGKLGLSIIAMLYDSVFMSQHFCLYPTAAAALVNGVRERKHSETSEFYHKLDVLRTTVFPQKTKHLVYDL